MYLRTTKRKNQDGTVIEYYQLAHNERHPETGNTVARVIHSFGRADRLDRDALVRLCHSIARVCGLDVTDPISENHVNKHHGLGKDVKILKTVEFGTVLALGQLWERLDIGKTLRNILTKRRVSTAYDKALFAMCANRLCAPESKLGVWDRWLKKVYLPSCESLELRHMYEAMDILHAHAAEIEEAIFFRTANLLNLSVDVIFYDTTTASFAIDMADESDDEGEGLRQFGRGKEGVWTPQVVVALAVTREGLPVRSWVLPGNTSDFSTIERVKSDLRGWNMNRAMFVADSGMNSAENRAELAKACGKYLLASRMASVAEIKNEVLSQPGRFKKIEENLHAKEVIIGDGIRQRRYILCFNPKEKERQLNHRAEVVKLLEEELSQHPDKNATAQWAVELLASKRYKKYLSVTKTGKLRIDRAKIREAGKYDGKWVLETNDDTITLEDAASGYKGLMVIERCFRSLKRTQIRMTPMYHWLPHRIEAHVKICVLALLLQRVAELACKQSWWHIRNNLALLQATEMETETSTFFQLNEPASKVFGTLKKLRVPRPPKVFGITKADKTG